MKKALIALVIACLLVGIGFIGYGFYRVVLINTVGPSGNILRIFTNTFGV